MGKRTVATLVCMGLLAAACLGVGSGETTSTVGTTASSTVETPASTEAATTQPAMSGVTVAEDLVYLAAEPNPWKLDVYFSPASEGGPVVVFFHGGGLAGRTTDRLPSQSQLGAAWCSCPTGTPPPPQPVPSLPLSMRLGVPSPMRWPGHPTMGPIQKG